MATEEEGTMKVWIDLCDKHARLLIDEEDYEEVNRLGKSDDDWPCLVEGCEEKANVQGLVRIELSPKKKEGVA